jgi:TatA/E family protein of Tat protein translocase
MTTLPLFLSDVAGSEILLILVFVLMFFGSKSIPGIARTMGRTIRQIKDASQEVQEEIKKSGGDLRADFNLQKMVDDTVGDIEKPFKEHAQTLDQVMNFESTPAFVKPHGSATESKPMDQDEAVVPAEENSEA